MGGSNQEFNLISLTYREHYLAHCLLSLSFPEDQKLKKAINSFRKSAKNSRIYQTLASHKHSEETKRKIGDSVRGKPRKKPTLSEKRRQQLADQCRQRGATPAHREKARLNAQLYPTIQYAQAAANRPDRDRKGLKNGRACKEVWGDIEFLRSVWNQNGKCGFKRLYTLTGIGNTPQSLKTVVQMFKDDDIV